MSSSKLPLGTRNILVGTLLVALSMLTFLSAVCQGQTTPEKKDAPQLPVDCPFELPPSAESPDPLKRGSGVIASEIAIYKALDWLAKHQMPDGSWHGGWGHAPRTRGDTFLFGIQMLAMTSGQLAGLQTKPEVFKRARRFLDSVQQDEGAAYGLTEPGDTSQTNAVGLLCRAYLGWDHSHAAFKKGVERLVANGLSPSNLHYNYFTSHLLYLDRLEDLHRWHREVRTMPIPLQATEGHEAGSWYFPGDPANDAGGRLYCTAMTCLTLEIYYRHLPLWLRQRPKLKP